MAPSKKSDKKQSDPEPETASLSSAKKKACRLALDVLEDRELKCDEWRTSWRTFHDSYTSKLNGLKPCYRKDSYKPEKPYHIGLAKSSHKSTGFPPIVEAAFRFEKDPEKINMGDVVSELRRVVDKS